MIERALRFATICHEGQKRKGTDIPYIMHPIEAATIVMQMQFGDDLICAALLHDVMEDCGVDYCAISKMFNEQIATVVDELSEIKSQTWEERKSHTIEMLKTTATEDIKVVKLADALSNIRSISRDDFKKQGYWERFNVSDVGKHAWHYRGLLEGLKDLKEFGAYTEFDYLVRSVFA